ncbi:MAG: stage III sporulation protein AF [Clostridia bacterium]|nr:stage III sporulation protein AF [Clostridia bacterium]
MIEFLKGWVLNIVTVVMLVVLLEILIPSGKFKKYINLVTGFILIITIINPFLSFFRNKTELKELQFVTSSKLERETIEQNSKVLKQKQMKQITAVYKSKIINQIEESVKEASGYKGAEAEVEINEDYTSKNFGEVKKVYLKLTPKDTKNAVKQVVKVEKIEVGKKKATGSSSNETDRKIPKEVKDKVTDSVNQLLGVKKDNIIITLKD